jgi:ATP-binding cassette subfamily F protein 2
LQLLLDEPTNHLDVFACTWLEQFLNAWEKTVVIVSHDRGFLNRVTRNTIFLHRQRLWYYGGSYDTFLKVRAEKRKHSAGMAKSNAKRQTDLKKFIARFGQGNRKMAKQAQSRMKLLDRIAGENVELDFDDPYLKLEFPAAQPLPPPCISVMNVSFGYVDDGLLCAVDSGAFATPAHPLNHRSFGGQADGCVDGGLRADVHGCNFCATRRYEDGKLLYEGLNFGIDCESRVAIVGPNGAGKSTMLSLLETDIIPVEGAISRHSKLRTAKFTQHHIEMFDMEGTSVDHMRRLDEDGPIEEARKCVLSLLCLCIWIVAVVCSPESIFRSRRR